MRPALNAMFAPELQLRAQVGAFAQEAGVECHLIAGATAHKKAYRDVAMCGDPGIPSSYVTEPCHDRDRWWSPWHRPARHTHVYGKAQTDSRWSHHHDIVAKFLHPWGQGTRTRVEELWVVNNREQYRYTSFEQLIGRWNVSQESWER